MKHVDFPWRPLGAVLVERGHMTQAQLEDALAEQRRTGRLLGQILVERGYLTNVSLARALADQHGVELRPATDREDAPRPIAATERRQRAWCPLGQVLVETGYLTEPELERALAEHRENPRRRLGEVLVERGYVTGTELARALAKQHGLEFDADQDEELRSQTVVRPVTADEPVYRVHRVAVEALREVRSVVYETTNFLDAADAAFELIEHDDPAAVEIDRDDGHTTETVWTYSAGRADAIAAERSTLAETFGFDPVRWNVGS